MQRPRGSITGRQGYIREGYDTVFRQISILRFSHTFHGTMYGAEVKRPPPRTSNCSRMPKIYPYIILILRETPVEIYDKNSNKFEIFPSWIPL